MGSNCAPVSTTEVQSFPQLEEVVTEAHGANPHRRQTLGSQVSPPDTGEAGSSSNIKKLCEEWLECSLQEDPPVPLEEQPLASSNPSHEDGTEITNLSSSIRSIGEAATEPLIPMWWKGSTFMDSEGKLIKIPK